MPYFTRGDGDTIIGRFEPDEAELLRGLGDEMKLLLEADIPRTDAVIQRLFPAVYDDPDDELQYREMVGADLQHHKRSSLATVMEGLDAPGADVTIEALQIDAWLSVLTDMRLAIGERLGVTEEAMEQEPDENDPNAPAWSVLHWLGWTQQSLIEATEEGM